MVKNQNTSANFIGYYNTTKEFKGDETELDLIMPIKRIAGINFSYIKGRNNIAVTLSPSAFGTEAIIRDRGGFDYTKGSLPLFKNKMALGEQERQGYLTALESENEKDISAHIMNIFDDEKTLMDSAITTQEYLRSRALFSGKIDMDYNGVSVVANFGYNDTMGDINQNRYDSTKENAEKNDFVSWNNVGSTPVDDMNKWADDREIITGVRPDTIWMNNKTFSLIRRNVAVMETVYNITYNGATTDAIKEYVEESTNMKLKIYNKKIQVNGKKVDLIKNGEVLLVPSTIDVGRLMAGTTPNEFEKRKLSKTVDIEVSREGIAISKWTSIDPVQLYTAAEMVCLPSFYGIQYCATAIVSKEDAVRSYSKINRKSKRETKGLVAK